MAGLNITVFKEKNGSLQTSVSESKIVLYQSFALNIYAELPYLHYPVNVWESTEFKFIVEGYFFDAPDYKKMCLDIAESCFSKNYRSQVLREKFSDIDAEFVLIIIRKSDDNFVLINDVLGRLPIYFIQSEESWDITRNILSVNDKISMVLNKEAAIDAFVFGFPLDSETLYKGLTRISGGSVIFREGIKLFTETYYEIDYDEIKNNNWNWEGLPQLVQIFTDGIINRIKFSDLNIVPLSGGLDSRTVAAGFKKEKIHCRYISFQDADGNTVKDIKVAEMISGIYQSHLEIFKLNKPQENDFEILFQKKAGMNFLDMSFIIPYLKYLSGLSTKPAMFTGEGGDKVFPDLTPIIPRPTLSLLRNYALYSNQKIPVKVAQQIIGNNNYSPLEKVSDLLSSYSEKSMSGKYVHFLMHNRVGNWLNEGEDRSRNFITSFTPFYNLKFFKAIMSVPEKYKSGYVLYRRFIDLIGPEVGGVYNANWGFTLHEEDKIRKAYFKEELKKTKLGSLLKTALKNKENYFQKLSEAESNLFERYAAYSQVRSNFELQYVKNLKNFDADSFYYLLTFMKISTLS